MEAGLIVRDATGNRTARAAHDQPSFAGLYRMIAPALASAMR
jgi:hypothetical protein